MDEPEIIERSANGLGIPELTQSRPSSEHEPNLGSFPGEMGLVGKGAWNDPSFWSGVTVPPGCTTARVRALDREAAASGRPIASGGNGHAYRVLVANEFFRGRLSDPAFQTSEANLIEFIKARGRALDREQVSNGSLTHPPATSGPGNKAATSGLPIGSHKSLCAPDHSRKRARPIGLVKTPGRRNWSPSCP